MFRRNRTLTGEVFEDPGGLRSRPIDLDDRVLALERPDHSVSARLTCNPVALRPLLRATISSVTSAIIR